MDPKPRKPRDQIAEAEYFLRDYRRLPPEASRAFTDGSSLDSGSGGSGFVSILGDGITRYQSTHMGLKTLFESMLLILTGNPLIPRNHLYTFTDNKYAIQSVDGKLKNRTNRVIIQEATAACEK